VKGIGGYHLAVLATDERAVAELRRRKRRPDQPFALMVADLEEARRLCEVDDAAAALLTGRARPIVLLPRRTHTTTAVDAAALAQAGAVADAEADEMASGVAGADVRGKAGTEVRRVAGGMAGAEAGTEAGGVRGAVTGGEGNCRVAEGVAPGSRHLGLMLPYTPLHHLLLAEIAAPIVLTSANGSGEPIVHDDGDALARLGGIADAFLIHDRPIQLRADDSVVRPFRGKGMLLRRSRGHAPSPFTLPWTAPRPILGCGAALKSTFCLAKGRHAIVSPHIGDLENYETLRSYAEGIEHFSALFDLRPEVVAHDLHPDYLSTKHAMSLPEVELVGVQHHHAHIAACLAGHGEDGRVIGVAFDGLGYGPDGTLWGGEFLVADLASYERAGHLASVPMPGGAAAIRQPWRMAAAYLEGDGDGLAVARRNRPRWDQVIALAGQGGLGAPLTSSAGRLFDAVAALIGVRDTVTYEGQAAIELEQFADPGERGGYPAAVHRAEGRLVAAGSDLVRAAAADLAAGTGPDVISARFHNGVADLVVRCCRMLREATGLATVALSGGVFQNVLLLGRTIDGLGGAGFRVLTHTGVPAGDGGISLGQVAVAAARDRLGPFGGQPPK
ncbi:carbamoyltransferase HypF, partial [Nonomuraea zeae]